MLYTVEYGKVNASPWSVEEFETEEEARERFFELREIIMNGTSFADTVMYGNDVYGEVYDLYTENEMEF